jgi:hypothetical protein
MHFEFSSLTKTQLEEVLSVMNISRESLENLLEDQEVLLPNHKVTMKCIKAFFPTSTIGHRMSFLKEVGGIVIRCTPKSTPPRHPSVGRNNEENPFMDIDETATSNIEEPDYKKLYEAAREEKEAALEEMEAAREEMEAALETAEELRTKVVELDRELRKRNEFALNPAKVKLANSIRRLRNRLTSSNNWRNDPTTRRPMSLSRFNIYDTSVHACGDEILIVELPLLKRMSLNFDSTFSWFAPDLWSTNDYRYYRLLETFHKFKHQALCALPESQWQTSFWTPVFNTLLLDKNQVLVATSEFKMNTIPGFARDFRLDYAAMLNYNVENVAICPVFLVEMSGHKLGDELWHKDYQKLCCEMRSCYVFYYNIIKHFNNVRDDFLIYGALTDAGGIQFCTMAGRMEDDILVTYFQRSVHWRLDLTEPTQLHGECNVNCCNEDSLKIILFGNRQNEEVTDIYDDDVDYHEDHPNEERPILDAGNYDLQHIFKSQIFTNLNECIRVLIIVADLIKDQSVRMMEGIVHNRNIEPGLNDPVETGLYLGSRPSHEQSTPAFNRATSYQTPLNRPHGDYGRKRTYIKIEKSRKCKEIDILLALQGNEIVVELKSYKIRADGYDLYLEQLIPFPSVFDVMAKSFVDCQMEALKFMLDVTRGLMHLKNHKIIHCDISPNNVMQTYLGTWKLVDFDHAVQADRNGEFQSDYIRGTDGYIAPEAIAKRLYSYSSDLYSMAMVAEILILESITASGFDPDHERISRKIELVQESMLVKDPKDRIKVEDAFSDLLYTLNDVSLDYIDLGETPWTTFYDEMAVQEFHHRLNAELEENVEPNRA